MKNLLQRLLIENRSAPRRFAVENVANDEATLYLYDMIVSDDWWGGVSAQSFVQALNDITAGTIHLRINSPGGDVFAARSMETAIRNHPSKIIAHVDGYAASAASFLMMGADDREISDGAFVMIHKASTFAIGNSDDMLATADLLEKVDATLVKTYADRTGQDPEQIAAWMSAETWFTADEAVENGFADRKAEFAVKADTSAWNMSAYQNTPAALRMVPPATPVPANTFPQPDRDALHRDVLRVLIPA